MEEEDDKTQLIERLLKNNLLLQQDKENKDDSSTSQYDIDTLLSQVLIFTSEIIEKISVFLLKVLFAK